MAKMVKAYQAEDGTLFLDPADCARHDEHSKLNKLAEELIAETEKDNTYYVDDFDAWVIHNTVTLCHFLKYNAQQVKELIALLEKES